MQYHSIPEFCKERKFSVAFYYKLKRLGKAPKETEVGRRRIISDRAAAEWDRQMSPDAASA